MPTETAYRVEFFPETDTQERRYELDGQRVPSATEVLGEVIAKPFLADYAARCTRQGVCALVLAGERLPTNEWVLKRILETYGYEHGQRTADAAERGTHVHAALEALARDGQWPDPGSDEHVAYDGYIDAMCSWVMDARPDFHETETVVGSREHGYAGTRDLVATIDGTRWLIDAKTSKRVYPRSHFAQLQAYELAGREMGLEPTEKQGILLLRPDGTYELVESTAPEGLWLALLGAYKALQAVPEK